MSLDIAKGILHRCFRCGYCKFTFDFTDFNCPAYKKYRFESYSSGGKMWLIWGLINNELKMSENLAKILYSCTTCGNCVENCKFEKFNDFWVDIIEAARAEAFKQGFGLEKFKTFGEHTAKEHNPYLESHQNRLDWLPGDVKMSDSANIAYYVGCTASYRQKKIAQDTVRILNRIGIEFQLSPEEWCCGSPLIRTGQTDIALEQAQHNVMLFKNAGIKTVFTSCAGCYRTLKEDYPRKFELELDFEVLHLTELLERNIEKLEFAKLLNKTVTYHDPCHLGRHANLYDSPRVILKKFPEINFVEMKKNRENSTCCGAGGGVKSGFSDWALEQARDRLLEAKEVNAEILVSTCPFCNRNFIDAKNEFNIDIDIFDLTELLVEHMK